MLANNAGLVRVSAYNNIKAALARGVNVRVILSDYTESNKINYDNFARAVGQNPSEARETVKNVIDDFKRINSEMMAKKKDNPSENIGKLELRWNKNPIFYTMWIRDAKTENAIGHLGIHFYQGKPQWPNIRVSPKNGGRLLENMSKEFDYAWKNSSESVGP